MSSMMEVEGWVEKLMGCSLLPETDIISLCKKAKETFNQVRHKTFEKGRPHEKGIFTFGH